MDREKIAQALVQCLLEEDEDVNFSHGVRDKQTNKHFLVTVQPYEPTTKIEKLLESVLYPAAKNTCKCCGK